MTEPMDEHAVTITAADRAALSELCLSFLKPPRYGGSWTLNPDALAEAIIAGDWQSVARDILDDVTKAKASVAAAPAYRSDRPLIGTVFASGESITFTTVEDVELT